MRTKIAIYTLITFLLIWCNPKRIYAEIDVLPEKEELRLFLMKGYSSSKNVLEDIKIEYETAQIPINPPPLSTAHREKLNTKTPFKELLTFTKVEEYIRKNCKERWIFLNSGKSSPTEDVSYRVGLIGTEKSPSFKVYDGQNILEYYPIEDDGFTKAGRAMLSTSKTGFWGSSDSAKNTPVKFLGYNTGLMPDDILSNPLLEIYTKPENINNLLTYRITAPIEKGKNKYKMIYWLSPERSCLPVRIEVERNGKLRRILETKEFIELDDGQWFIRSILQKNFITKGGNDLTEAVNWLYTVRKIELHPEVNEVEIFKTSLEDLPEGTHIIDNVSGLRYFSGEGPVSNQRISNIMKESLESLNEIQNENPSETFKEIDKEQNTTIEVAENKADKDTDQYFNDLLERDVTMIANKTKRSLQLKQHIEHMKEIDRKKTKRWDLPEDIMDETSTDKLFLHFVRSPLTSFISLYIEDEIGVQRLINASSTLYEFYTREDLAEGALKMYQEYDLSPDAINDECIISIYSANKSMRENPVYMQAIAPDNIMNTKIVFKSMNIRWADKIMLTSQFFPKIKGYEREYLKVMLDRYEKVAELQEIYGEDKFVAALSCVPQFCRSLAKNLDEEFYIKLKNIKPTSEAGKKQFIEEIKNYLKN